MPSPFPGMDPYLEATWRDVHTSLIVYIRDALHAVLPSSLRIRVEQRVVAHVEEQEDAKFSPDAAIVERRPGYYHTRETLGVAVTEPLVLDAEPEEYTEGYLEITERGATNRVVTAIELLSPSNKTPGADRDKYLAMQKQVCGSDTNLVEIDLLLAGQHTVAVPRQHIRPEKRLPYVICVRRATKRIKAEVYPIALDFPLPAISIPLRPTDTDVPLSLQPLLEKCYQVYEGDIDYTKDPPGPLSEGDAKWIDQLLRDKGLRATPAPKPSRKRATKTK